MRYFRSIGRSAIVISCLVVIVGTVAGQETLSNRFTVLGGLGISGARGDYPSEYDARTEFSFFPGLRFRSDGLVTPETFLMFDFGYLEAGFVGYVASTDSYFYRTYEYLNLNAMIGAQTGALYYCGGLYIAPNIDAYDYRSYTDEYVYLDSNGDFGLVGEVGVDLAPFISLGVQPRWGLRDVGSKVEIRNFGLLATISLHFYRF